MRRTAINAASVFAGEFLIRCVNFFVPILIARIFDASALGKYSLGIACAALVLPVTDFGLHLLTTREVASHPGSLSSYFWSVQSIKLTLSAVVGILVLSVTWACVPDQETRWVIWILTLRMFLQSTSYFFMAIIKGFERMHYLVILQIANMTLVFIGLGLAVYLRWPLSLLLCAFLPGVVCECLLGGFLVFRRFGPLGSTRLCWPQIRLIAGAAFPIGLGAILITFNLRLDVLILSRFQTASVVGLFSAANMLSTGFFLLASLAISVVFPKMSKLAKRSPAEFHRYVETLLRVSLFWLVPVASLIFLGAEPLVRFLYGARYSSAAPLLKILAFSIPLIFINAILFYSFISKGGQSSYLWVMASGVGINLMLTPVLTWWLSSRGTALSNLFRETSLLLMFVALLLHEHHNQNPVNMLVGSAASLLAITVFGVSLRLFGLGTASVLVAVPVVYLLVSVALQKFPKGNEIRFLAQQED